MEPLQIIVLVFALFALSRSLLRWKDKAITNQEFLFWTLLWAAVIIVALAPGLTYFIAAPLGIKRGIDIAVYVGVMLLFYLIFRLYVKTEKTNQEITQLVRALAKEKQHKNKK